MEGLEVEPNPLDAEFIREEPSVIHEDKYLIVVDKPSGMLSVPGRTSARSLLEWLRDRYGEVHSCQEPAVLGAAVELVAAYGAPES